MKSGSRSVWLFGVISAACVAVLAPSGAEAKISDVAAPVVEFHSIGPAGMKIDGVSHELRVDDDGTNVTITVPLAPFVTGISLRDKHMKEKYLEVQTYPAAVFKTARANLKFPAAGAETSADAPGTLEMHGKSKPASVHYTARRAGDKLSVTGTVHINMNDFGIETPGYLGVKVKPDVDVQVKFDASDK